MAGSTHQLMEAGEKAVLVATALLDGREPTDADLPRLHEALNQARSLFEQGLEALATEHATVARGRTSLRLGWVLQKLGRYQDTSAQAVPLLQQAADAASRGLAALDCIAEREHCMDGYVTLSSTLEQLATAAQGAERQKLIDQALSHARAAEYLTMQAPDDHRFAALRQLQARLLEESYSGDRDQNLSDALWFSEQALAFFEPRTRDYPLEAPFILLFLGNALAKINGDRDQLMRQARDAYRRALALVDRDRLPKLYQTIVGNIAWAEDLIAESQTELPLQEMSTRFQLQIQHHVTAGEGSQAQEVAWSMLRWSWSLPTIPNIYLAAGHSHIANLLTYQGAYRDAATHHYAALACVSALPADPEVETLRVQFGQTCAEAFGKIGRAEQVEAILAQAREAIAMAQDACSKGAQLMDQDINAALPEFERAIALFPFHPIAQFYLGAVKMNQGDDLSALGAFNAALALTPHHVASLVNRGIVFFRLGRDDAALGDLGRVLKIKPKSAPALANRSQVFYRKHDYERARVDIEKFLELEPNSMLGYSLRAACHEKLENLPAALADLEKIAQAAGDPEEKQAVLRRIGELRHRMESQSG